MLLSFKLTIVLICVQCCLASPAGQHPEMRKTRKCIKEYVTNKGDSCFELRSEYGLTKEEFLEMNPNVKCKGGLMGSIKLCLRRSTKNDSEEEIESLRDLLNGRRMDSHQIRQHFDSH